MIKITIEADNIEELKKVLLELGGGSPPLSTEDEDRGFVPDFEEYVMTEEEYYSNAQQLVLDFTEMYRAEAKSASEAFRLGHAAAIVVGRRNGLTAMVIGRALDRDYTAINGKVSYIINNRRYRGDALWDPIVDGLLGTS